MKTSDFFYDLPESAIAQRAVEPRDSSRLLDTRTMSDHTFADLPDLLDPGDLVVVNRTRVRRARLQGRKSTGGAVEVLLLRARDDKRWEALAQPTRRLRFGTLIRFGDVEATVESVGEDGTIVLRCDADLAQVAEAVGEVPLPPYFHGSLATDERYQTLFADRLGSAAAPTAALHFTPDVVGGLGDRGIGITRIDLEVGLDTFRPIAVEDISDHQIHTERIIVEPEAADAVNLCRDRGGRIVAIGTTVVRTLESAWHGSELRPFAGATDLFISPGYEFKATDLVVTNFHVPGSTLVVLLASLLGDAWREVYRSALERQYRFLSFGDAMLAEVAR